jgi:flagellar operon protein
MSSTLRMPAINGGPGSVVSKDPIQAPDRAIDKQGGIGGLKQKSTESGVAFNEILNSELNKAELNQVQQPLKFSAHANARIQSRKLEMGPEQMRVLNEAVDKAKAKGLDDALILTKDGAFIVSVSNRTVVTALDKNSLDGSVFTNIDGAVIM